MRKKEPRFELLFEYTIQGLLQVDFLPESVNFDHTYSGLVLQKKTLIIPEDICNKKQQVSCYLGLMVHCMSTTATEAFR